jgi:ligand-binding sensor domain-containing protein
MTAPAAPPAPDPHKPDTALPNRMILALAEAEPGEAWIGTQLGCTTPATMARRSSACAAAAQPYPRIGALLMRKGELWLGTYEGLLRYTPATGALRHYVQGRRKAAA